MSAFIVSTSTIEAIVTFSRRHLDSIEPLLQGCEIEGTIDLQRRHDAQPDGAMHSGVESIKINGIHFGVQFAGFARPE